VADAMTPLDFRNVSFRYRRGPEVLSGVNLTVHKGELVTIIGPNGAGKSTLLRLGAGILRPVSGDVKLCGDDAHLLSRREAARRAALVVEIEPSELGLTVAEALLQAAYPHQPAWELFPEEAEERLAEVMGRMHLTALAARPVGELSDGERKRTALARALMQDVPLVMLDEPAGHLDFASQAELVAALERLKAEGKTVITVEHNFLVSGRVADRVVLLANGRIVADGTPSEVLNEKTLEETYGAALDVRNEGGRYYVSLR